MPINLMLDHVWISIVIAGVMPPILYVAFRIRRRGGKFVIADLRNAVLIGLIPTALLLLLQVAVLTRKLENEQAPPQQSISAPTVADAELTVLAGQWHPNTAEELIDKVSGLTDVERENAIKNDLGLLVEVEGEVWDVTENAFDNSVQVAIILSSDNDSMAFVDHRMAFAESASATWTPRLRTYQKGSRIRAVGALKNIRPGYVSLELYTLK